MQVRIPTFKVSFDSWLTESLVCKNMQMVYAERLKKLTFDMRRMEKEHCAKVQELHGGDKF